MIEGVQGRVGTKDFLAPDHLIATTKHFLGDGGTGGRDQGDTKVPEEVLRDVHLGGYPAAIEAGPQSVMASFSSRSEEHTSELQSLMRISYAVFCLKTTTTNTHTTITNK